MYIKAETLDDLLRVVFETIIAKGGTVTATKGRNKELFGVLLNLSNPRARLSLTETKGTIFSCLGEFLWYLSGSNDLQFIKYYIPTYDKFSDDGKTLSGAYGPRLFNLWSANNQFETIVNILKKKPSSRQAVIQIFNASDLLKNSKDVPCTCALQFTIRNNQLQMLTTMRSNDAFLGLPHDIFAFTMLQEILAKELGVGLGDYKHSVGSLHLYGENLQKAKQYLDEGWQSTLSPMPEMPDNKPLSIIL